MFFVSFVLISFVTDVTADPNFRNASKIATVTSHQTDETSGIAASRTHPGILYIHNDHGDQPHIYAIDNSTGHVVSTITINHAYNFDWEDIAYGVCPGGYCLYIGDFGDSGFKNILYMIREPANVKGNQHVDIYKKLHFSWNEPDTETLLVDPQGEVYIISKTKHIAAKAAHVPSSGWNSGTTVALTNLVSLTFNTSHHAPTGGDLSPNGKELLVVSHDKMYYWSITNGDVLSALSTHPIEVPYLNEPQGEAVCWDPNGKGYYTLSEGYNQPLYYYSRM